MCRFYQIILTAFLFSHLTNPVLGVCEVGWIQNGLFCYYYSVENATADQAQKECQVFYADLLYLDDDAENVFVFDNRPIKEKVSYWIGYSQVFKLIWRWVSSGKSGAFGKWDIGEPDGEGGCARLTPYLKGVWRDWECSRRLPYICKKYADCGPPVEMPLSTFTLTPNLPISNTTVFPLGASVTYTCTTGNEFPDESRSKTAFCSIGGNWDPDIPRSTPCEPIQCLAPPVFNDKTLTNGTALTRSFGTLIYYRCEDGYWFDQFSEGETRYLKCATDKSWTGEKEINDCSKVYCIRPVTSNSRADTPLNSFGTVATYKCNTGYEYSDNTSVKAFTCTENGWDPKPTPCLRLQCPEYNVRNAVPDMTERGVFTTVIWSCVPGMRYPDTTTRKSMYCKLDQTWATPILEGCERKKCEGPPPNASLSDTYTSDYNESLGVVFRYGDAVNYTCIPEWYFSDGLTVRQVFCNEDGEWSPQVVTECLGEIVEVKHGITHPPKEVEGADTFGTLTYLMLGILAGVMFFLDVITFGKNIGQLRENLCGPPKEDTPDTSKSENAETV